MRGVMSRNGYGSDDISGADDNFTVTFGYVASAADAAHDRQVRLLGRRPEPVRGAVGEPRGLFDGDVDANPEHTDIRRR